MLIYQRFPWPVIAIHGGSILVLAALGIWARTWRRVALVSVGLAAVVLLGLVAAGACGEGDDEYLALVGGVAMITLPAVGTWVTMTGPGRWPSRVRVPAALALGAILAVASPWVYSLVYCIHGSCSGG